MSRPNKDRRKKTRRASQAASRKSAATGQKKKAKAPPASAKPGRMVKLSKVLLRLAKALAKQRVARMKAATAAKSKSPQHSTSPPNVQSAPEPPGDHSLTPAPSTIPRPAPNGGDYHSKYLLEIYGGLKPDGSHLLIIDRKTRIKIDWLQFMVLLILASHARSKAGLDSPMDLRGGDYLQPSRIEEIIKQLKEGSLLCGERRVPECQNAYGADLVRNAKWDLRLRVQRKHKNPNFLDRGDGAGYRISAPPGRIKITLLIDGAHDLIFDWSE